MPPAATTTAASRRQARSRSARPRPRAEAARQPLRIRWERVGRVLLVVVLAVVAGLYIQQGITYLSARGQADTQNAIAAELARHNAKLILQEKALNNPATLQRDARALGMVRPGERPYVVTGLPAG